MERSDEELLVHLSQQDARLKRLYDQHRKLEKEVERLSRYEAYSYSAQVRVSALKKEKLRGMDEMMSRLKRAKGARSTDYEMRV